MGSFLGIDVRCHPCLGLVFVCHYLDLWGCPTGLVVDVAAPLMTAAAGTGREDDGFSPSDGGTQDGEKDRGNVTIEFLLEFPAKRSRLPHPFDCHPLVTSRDPKDAHTHPAPFTRSL